MVIDEILEKTFTSFIIEYINLKRFNLFPKPQNMGKIHMSNYICLVLQN